ncbi:unnamed protein product [Rodentolepis nana]|uniref:ANK_REP_REGION domain-containing protein n=1 Tax=Rodentolepis nana TaxID=102285 RepID=A0A0R3T5W9_RODNA|nr:unnamed protein product [Rodentolepis nana]
MRLLFSCLANTLSVLRVTTLCKLYENALSFFSKADANSRMSNGSRTVLMIAASLGFSEILRILLSQGASINASDSDGNFAIHLAAECGQLECVRLLMEKRCLANVGNKLYHTPLMLAAAEGHIHIVNHLLDNGVNMAYKLNKNKESELSLAALNNHSEIVKVLTGRANVDINRQEELNATYSLALLDSSNEVIEALLFAGADVNYCMIAKVPTIFIAISRKNVQIVKTLHKYGVDLNAVVEDGYSALMYATAEGDVEIVKYLVSHGKQKFVACHTIIAFFVQFQSPQIEKL